MGKSIRIWLILTSLVFGFGCSTMPPSRPGTVKIVNQNEGAYGYATLFRGNYSKDDLFALNPATGNLVWAIPPLIRIRIESALTRDFWKYLRLDLIPEQEYTLYIFWTRFYGRELGESVVSFKAYVDPRRRCNVDQLGIRNCASEIVYLPRVQTTTIGRFRIDKTFYPGQAIKDLFNLP